MTLSEFRTRIRNAGRRPALAAFVFGFLVPGALLLTANLNPASLGLSGTNFLGLGGVTVLTIGLGVFAALVLSAYVLYALFKPALLDDLVTKRQQQRRPPMRQANPIWQVIRKKEVEKAAEEALAAQEVLEAAKKLHEAGQAAQLREEPEIVEGPAEAQQSAGPEEEPLKAAAGEQVERKAGDNVSVSPDASGDPAPSEQSKHLDGQAAERDNPPAARRASVPSVGSAGFFPVPGGQAPPEPPPAQAPKRRFSEPGKPTDSASKGPG